jgi:putative membrane protein
MAPRPPDDDPPRGPRVIHDEPGPPAPRLDFGWEQAVTPAPPARAPRWSTPALVASGAAVLVLGLSALEAANFVAAQFERSDALGWLTLGVAALGYGLIGAALWREARGLVALRAVDRAREAFARGDFVVAREETLRWAAEIPAAQSFIPALRGANHIDTLRAVLESGPLAALDAQATALGRTAALQSFAVTAISPSAGADAVIFVWRGVRLVRQVAALHGLRPGIAATMRLLRRTALDATTVAAADIAIDTATRAVLTNPLLRHVAGETGVGAVAARRMILLARAAAEACRILPREGRA